MKGSAERPKKDDKNDRENEDDCSGRGGERQIVVHLLQGAKLTESGDVFAVTRRSFLKGQAYVPGVFVLAVERQGISGTKGGIGSITAQTTRK